MNQERDALAAAARDSERLLGGPGLGLPADWLTELCTEL